jgi:hypothetical protein
MHSEWLRNVDLILRIFRCYHVPVYDSMNCFRRGNLGKLETEEC